MRTEELAIVVYGALTFVMVAILAIVTGATTALFVLSGAVASTYAFQVIQFIDVRFQRTILTFWALAVLLTIVAAVLALKGI